MASPLTTRLVDLRAGLRARWLAAGVLRVLAELLGFLALQFCLDRFLFLPASARRVVVVVAGGLLLWRLFLLVVKPMRHRVGTMDVALAVERRHRELDGGLASVVEFDARGADLPPDVSPTLLEMWRRDVEARGSQIAFSDVFDPRLLRRLAAVNGVALALAAAFVVLRPEESGIFAQRLLGSDVDWPRRTHLELDVDAAAASAHLRVERDAAGKATRVVVARGASLPIVVRAKGAVPEEVLLVVREKGRAGSEEVRMAVREGSKSEFGYRFGHAVRAMELNAEGGDDPGRESPLAVEVLPSPGVEKLVAAITPPAYTRRPPTREERQDFAVPAGTRLDLEITTTGDVTEGTLTLHSDPGTARPLERDAQDPKKWRASLVAEDSGTFNLHLTGKSGFKNLQNLDYPLTVLADRKPSIDVARPSVSDLEVTANGVVPFRLLVDDDYGVTKLGLAFTRMGEKEPRRLALQGEGSDRPDLLVSVGEPSVVDARLDLHEFKFEKGAVAEGDTITYVATAQDDREQPVGTKAPNETTTTSRRIDVVSEGEKTRKLADRQQRVKQNVAAAKKSQEERLKGLQSLLTENGDGALQPKELTALEVEQGRVVTSARQISRELCDVTQEFVLNRLDHSPIADRVVGFLLTRLEASHAGPAFDFDPFVQLTAAQKKGEFGELHQLANVVAMLDLGVEASETHAQRALEQLRAARVSGASGDRANSLRNAEDAEKKVVETYALLLQKMEEWEDYQEILDLWRTLVQDQREINVRSKPSPSGAVPTPEPKAK
jgi:hypothetical protein